MTCPRVRPLRLRRAFLLIGCVCWGPEASGQAGGQATPSSRGTASQATPAGEDVVVTGRAVPGAVIGDIPPQNQLSPADIAAYGVGTISELLDQIAEQTQSDQGRDSSSGPVVLVNGKRISGVNEVADLPTESILRVDILPEEVALKYGYDAQRKVVNIILRRRVRAKVANLNGGVATEGQGGNESGDLTYTRIHDNDRINVALRAAASASLLESERGLASSSSAVDPTGTIGTDTAARTLKPSTRTYLVNASVAHQLGATVGASFNAQASYATSDALQGLADATLAVSATSPDAAGTEAATLDRFLSPVALGQRISTASAHGGLTLNADLSNRWKLSLIAAYDHSDSRTETDRGYDTTALQAAIMAGTAGPDGVLPSTLLGAVQRDSATALGDSGSASLVAMGKLWRLPAGDMGTSVRVGGDISALTATGIGSDVAGTSISRRSDAIGQVSLDLPLTSRRTGFLAGAGTLTANVNAGVTQVSGYGTLGTLGYGVNWTLRTGLTVIASVNEDRVAPTLQQLDAPTVATANLRVYDYLLGQTATVTQITGCNPTLKADDRHVVKLGLTLNPLRHASLSVTANYINSRTRNAIGTLLGATAATEAAFADRFTRDATGALVAVDSRPVNFASEDRQELRWGFTLSQVLRAPKRPPPPTGWRWPPRVAAGSGGEVPDGAARPDRPPAESTSPAGAGDHPQGSDDDIVVEGRRDRDGDDGGSPPPPPPPGGPDDGMGPPPGGPPPDGFGPPPAGLGGPPGGGPPGGGPGGGRGGGPAGFGGSDNGLRLQLSAYHSWFFSDRVLLRAGVPVIDLLDGGTIGSGGQPRHSVEFNTGLIDNGLGLRLSGSWRSATRVEGGTTGGAGTLSFSSLATFDLRLFANLANRFRGKAWARGTRMTLAIGNLFDTRQRVTDAAGATPLIYQGAYLDPYGRTLSLSLRRLF